MGDFDMVEVDDERFVCSEGHSLGHEQFQTKDFDCIGRMIRVANGRVTFDEQFGKTSPYTGTFTTYTSCLRCPAFVQKGTANVITTWVEFEVAVVVNKVQTVTLISQTTPEFIANTPTSTPYMEGCEGPMTYEIAVRRSDVLRGR